MGLRFVLLALLSKESNTGYGLGRMLRNQLNHLWEARLQQIYSELSSLESHGLIEKEVFELPNRPSKKLYSLTEAGQQELNDWLLQPPTPVPSKDDLLVRLYCLDRIPRNVAVRRLEEVRDQSDARVKELRGKLEKAQAAKTPELGHVLGLEAALARAEAQASWCAEALASVREGADDT